MKLLTKIRKEIDDIADDLVNVIIPYPSVEDDKKIWEEVCNKKRIAREKIEKILKKYAELIISEKRK